MNSEKQLIMDNESQELFQLATKFFYRKYKKKGGSQKKLAQELGVSHSYLSSVINASRSASLDLQNHIANILYGPYDQFLSAGRQLKEGIELPGERKQRLRDNVETLLARLTHYVMNQKKEKGELKQTNELYKQVIENLQSGVFVTNKNDKVFFANQFMSEIEGTSVDQIIGVDMLSGENKFPDADRSQFAAYYLKAKKILKPVFFENITITTAAGELIRQTGWAIPRLKDDNYDGMICKVNRIERKKRKTLKRKNKTCLKAKQHQSMEENITFAGVLSIRSKNGLSRCFGWDAWQEPEVIAEAGIGKIGLAVGLGPVSLREIALVLYDFGYLDDIEEWLGG